MGNGRPGHAAYSLTPITGRLRVQSALGKATCPSRSSASMPRKPGTYWNSETERVERDGKSLLVVKIPSQLLKPELMLVADSKVTDSYSDSTGVASGPGTVPLGDITDNRTRTIFAGIPSMAVAPKGRLWATWYSGPRPAEDLNNYVVLSTANPCARKQQALSPSLAPNPQT